MVCTAELNFPIQLIHPENKVLCDQPQAAENLLLPRKLDCSLGIHNPPRSWLKFLRKYDSFHVTGKYRLCGSHAGRLGGCELKKDSFQQSLIKGVLPCHIVFFVLVCLPNDLSVLNNLLLR